MGYNIADISGNGTGAGAFVLGDWTFTLDLDDPSATTVGGDFDVVSLFGASTGEATSGYTFGPLSTTAYGSLSFNTTTGTFTFTVNRAAVMATGTDQTVTFTITGTSGANTDSDIVTIEILICFLKGSRIATPTGEVAVEDLATGDLVCTRDGGPQPIRWICKRCVRAAESAADPSLRPIRIAADALGPGNPRRDLWVSPQHRMLLADWRAELMFGEAEVLAPAKALVNDTTICTDHSVEAPEYYHVLLDRHEVIFAEGAATESFYPGEFTLSAVDPKARATLADACPDLMEAEVYGDLARRALRPWEARCLLEAL